MNSIDAIRLDVDLINIFSIVLVTFVLLVVFALLCTCLAHNAYTKALNKELEKNEEKNENISRKYEEKLETLEDIIHAKQDEIETQKKEMHQMYDVIKKDAPFAVMLVAYELYDEYSPILYMLFNRVCYDFSENNVEMFLKSIDEAITYLKTVPVSKDMMQAYSFVKECYEDVPALKRELKVNNIKEVNSMIYKAEHDS